MQPGRGQHLGQMFGLYLQQFCSWIGRFVVARLDCAAAMAAPSLLPNSPLLPGGRQSLDGSTGLRGETAPGNALGFPLIREQLEIPSSRQASHHCTPGQPDLAVTLQ